MIDLPTESEPVRIIAGDCLEVLPRLPAGCVDSIVTDPPYGIGSIWQGGFSKGHGWSRANSEKSVRNEWDAETPPPEVWPMLTEVSKKVVIWGGNYFPLPPSRCWFVWVKPERGFTLAEAELAWTSLDSVARCYDAPRHIADREHPTQKPVGLMRWCIRKLKLNRGDLILDPFGGSGTTAVAAIAEGMRCILIEREPGYCEIARKRVEAAMCRGPGSLLAGVS